MDQDGPRPRSDDAPATAVAGRLRTIPGWVRILLVVTAVRLAAALAVPVLPEESYHWNYARHPDWSYHDHPPMIGWWIAAGLLLFGDTAMGIRVVPLLFVTGATILLARLARRLWGEAAASWAVLLVAIEPLALLMAGTGFPDSPLVFFWCLALTFTLNALESGKGPWWLAAGAAMGGAMLSKYTAFFFGLFVLIHLLVSARDRRWLATPWPYLAGAVAIAVFTPVVCWNAAHDWISFRFQSVEKLQASEGVSARWGLKFLGGQWLTNLPLTLPLAAVAAAAGFRSPRPAERFLAWSFAPMFAFFFLVGWTRSIHPQWPLPAYLGLTLLMAGAAAGSPDRVSSFYRRHRPALLAVAAAALLGLIAHAAFFLPGLTPLKGLYGWEAGARKASEIRAASAPDAFYLAVGRQYTCASQLAYRLREPYRVHGSNLLGVRNLQYDFWSRPEELRGRDAVVVVEGADRREGALSQIRRSFRSVEPAGELVVPVGRNPVLDTPPVSFAFFVARGYDPPGP